MSPQLSFLSRTLSVSVSVFLLTGWAHAAEKTVSLNKCPASVQITIKKRIGKGEIVSIVKDHDDGDVDYEIRVKMEGVERRLTVDESGEFVFWEDAMMVKDCPAPVRATIKQKVGPSTPVKVSKLTDDEGVEYCIVVKKGNTEREFYVENNGQFITWESVTVSLKDCPSAVQKAIKDAAGDFVIEEIEDAVEEFAAHVSKEGRQRVLYVTSEGLVRSQDDILTLAKCPPAIQKTIKTEAGENSIKEIVKTTTGKKVEYTVTISDGELEGYFTVDADGKLVLEKE